ncbi:MAG TPA: DUF1499 domain-containing protein [Candidatus Margulisiibacteriota bacterium]|nr:DUF1499 domain-containing protein [Candidatus Margulisiibacteriota bacterium]
MWATRLGIAAVVAFVAGPLLAHFHVLPALAGFAVFVLGGLLGIIAAVSGIVRMARGGGVGAGLAVGVVLTVTFLIVAAGGRNVPRINDITTDTASPPRFVAAGSIAANQGRDMTYPGPSFAEQQRAGYPDLAPLQVAASPDDVYKRVEAIAQQMPTWQITRRDPAAHALEGVDTTPLFQFQDDFVIEVRPQDGGSVVQMRSKSRDGKGDIGANAARIKAFFAKLG